jgi:hypothetical protein
VAYICGPTRHGACRPSSFLDGSWGAREIGNWAACTWRPIPSCNRSRAPFFRFFWGLGWWLREPTCSALGRWAREGWPRIGIALGSAIKVPGHQGSPWPGPVAVPKLFKFGSGATQGINWDRLRPSVAAGVRYQIISEISMEPVKVLKSHAPRACPSRPDPVWFHSPVLSVLQSPTSRVCNSGNASPR